MEQLGTKAETLNRLYGQLQNAKVLPQLCFTVKEWENKKAKIVETFHGLEWNTSVVVRSSALSEDTASESGAGKYESVLDVSGEREFEAAVTQVIASYEDLNENNQILVQPMLKKVMLCGVAFTIDPNTLGHYYVINYDKTGSTSAVTSGRGTENFLYYQFKSEECWNGPADMQRICKALKELETFFCQENLDVEFAVTEEGIIYIMQVRSLCLKRETVDYGKQKNDLIQITEKIKTAQAPKPFLCGRKAIYSVMTDWNPAEMIGIRPKPLAMSLYREIITDSVWAYQRDNYGYRNLRSFPLMVDFCGMPYIDIRVSFNSFIPAELEEELSEKLVNYYIDRLTEHPQKHDKAEFEIVFSCYTLDLPERIQILKDYGFSEVEIQKLLDALRNVTNRIIDHENGLWRKDYGKIEILNKRYEEIMSSSLSDMEKVYWLLEDCKRYGTLPFAGLARGAFIAVQILQSLVKCGILSKQDYECFMNGVNTVSSTMQNKRMNKKKQTFVAKTIQQYHYIFHSCLFDQNIVDYG